MENTVKNDMAALRMRVEASLDRIRPFLMADGGNIELVDISADNVMQVKLVGNCENCHLSEGTMTMGIKETIRRDVPEIVRIETIEA